MDNSVIWIVVFAQPRNKTIKLRELQRMRCDVIPGMLVDLMRPNRKNDAVVLEKNHRIAVHFGGSLDQQSQHLVQAGYVFQQTRDMMESDLQTYPKLSQMTAQAFPGFEVDPNYPELIKRQGVIVYRVFNPPPQIGILPKPYKGPSIGQNFIPISPGMPEYGKINDWWNKVVPNDQIPA
jgi:hypothetical protein